jgi:hypothetical protein
VEHIALAGLGLTRAVVAGGRPWRSAAEFMGRWLMLLASSVVATLALPALVRGTGSDTRIYLPIGCGKVRLAYRPTGMCLGNGVWFRRMTWETYGGRQATFHGQYEANTCKPSCAQGRSYWKHVRMTVWRVRWACGKRIYTRLGMPAFRLWVPGFDRCPAR